MERHHESEHAREIPLEILQDIMLRLPTRDVIRSSCVSKLWRSIVKDPTFVKLHAADHALASSESEALLVSVNHEAGRLDEASFFDLPSGVAMCPNVVIPSKYSLANICNSFVCFAVDGYNEVPVFVCNPVTGETLELAKAPPLSVSEENGGHVDLWHRFVLGFSPPTQEYKMFRLSFPRYRGSQGQKTNYIAVYTLGSRDGWRQYSYTSHYRPSLHTLSIPVHIDGNLYIMLESTVHLGQHLHATRILVLNVATETHCMYRVPYNYLLHGHGHHKYSGMLAKSFELNRQMCLVMNAVLDEGPRSKLQFWVMKSPDELGGKDDGKLHWDLRYCFDMVGQVTFPRGAWLDHDKMLCYLHANFLYKHDTGGNSLSSDDGLLLFDQKLELPGISSLSCDWNICGGYRPSLLSPLTFALPPSQDEKDKKRRFEHTLLHALRQSKKMSH